MSLFQSVVVAKYLRQLEANSLDAAWERYAACFLNPLKQANIRASKEEQYQEGFLRDLFVDVLGYTLNPNPEYNLTTEFKNQTSSKKADGAILKDGHAIGVIELKGMNTTDMSKIEAQAFGYKNNQPHCRYVITANFQKLRLYIDNAVEFIEFDLFTMTQAHFASFYLLLNCAGIMSDLPAKIKSESLSQEEAITKKLYQDYSVFKRELFADLTANNPTIDALLLFQKSQKLLDRLLFIFFAEDCHLLPANFAKGIISEWQQLKALKMSVPLYTQFKQYFSYLDTGYKDEHCEIFAYNGGLFRPDALLDSVIISDEVLRTHILTLSEYDFDSEVDVNILGHIFENSLNELDEVKATLAGETIDKSQTKRKKDGVFYTPKYITKYIVENTVGKLCTDKKHELEVNEEDYQQEEVTLNKSGKKRKKTDKRIAEEKVALARLHAYRDWLLKITICDPACGSGAFLNEALNFLIAEHNYILELETKLFGSGLAYPDIENSILENNLFGVDINEESVDIAKLSLWLRTAQPHRKLNNLNNNIQCGNSLIDDPEVAGDKAFNWQTAFPQVFAKGGFDVVIGNPPYVRADAFGNDPILRDFLVNRSKFKTLSGKWDLYVPFIELSHLITNSKGVISLIIPDAYCHSEYAKSSLNNYIAANTLLSIDYFPNINIFENVGVHSVIVNYGKNKTLKNYQKNIHNDKKEISTVNYENYPTSFRYDFKDTFLNKTGLADISDIFYISVGIVGNSDEKIAKGEFKVGDLVSEKQDLIHNRLYYEGKNISKWMLAEKRFIEYNTDRSPSKWRRKGFPELFLSRKVVTMSSPGQNPRSFIDDGEGFFNQSAVGFVRWCDLKGVDNNSISQQYDNNRENKEIISAKYSIEECLAYFNSKLFRYELNADRRSNIHIYPDDWRKLELPNSGSEELKSLAIKAIDSTSRFYSNLSSFVKYFNSKYLLQTISKKLQNWHELSFTDFIKELTKAIKATNKIRIKEGQSAITELTKKDEFEWMELFESKQQEVLQLQQQIAQTDSEIDQMVYALYDLTADEIAIIEAS